MIHALVVWLGEQLESSAASTILGVFAGFAIAAVVLFALTRSDRATGRRPGPR